MLTAWSLRRAALLLPLAACSASITPPDGAVARDGGGPVSDAPAPATCSRSRATDILFVIDNTSGNHTNQLTLARNVRSFFDALLSPPTDPATGRLRYPAATSLRVGVISTDLGTPGSTVPSCTNSDIGDDGRLNPIRNGQAIRLHQPWMSAPAGTRPARCAANDPNQYPLFLTFDAAAGVEDLRDDFVCYGYLAGGGGCGLEQPLEAAYRALVVHDAREAPGNRRANAGFVRDGAVLGLVVLSDEEDGSVRDCRYAEPGAACDDATGVFDSTSARWATTDLNLRFYMYRPGDPQDPTWGLDRYLDPSRPGRGLTAIKPGAPQLVVFGAIAGVPMSMPMRTDGGVDWDLLLGRNPDGSDGFVGSSPEGPISMRQGNMDPSCASRVVPSCRREGTMYDPARPGCFITDQPFAWPSRRIAQVVRRFDEHYGNGVIGSACRTDYGETLRAIAERVASRFCP
jgi:hypothetical protein